MSIAKLKPKTQLIIYNYKKSPTIFKRMWVSRGIGRGIGRTGSEGLTESYHRVTLKTKRLIGIYNCCSSNDWKNLYTVLG